MSMKGVAEITLCIPMFDERKDVAVKKERFYAGHDWEHQS